MHKLLYTDVTNAAIREEIFRHLASQARAVSAGTTPRARPAHQSGARHKILSDVDGRARRPCKMSGVVRSAHCGFALDTLISSGGVFPAGVDARLPRGVVYPGVLALFQELDLGAEQGAVFRTNMVSVATPSGSTVQVRRRWCGFRARYSRV